MLAATVRKSALFFLFIAFASPVFAKQMRYLIKYKDGKPSAQLASKWTKVEGGYEFTLDTTQEVSKGKTVNAEMVKESIGKRLAKKGMTLEAKGEDKVVITFKEEEEDQFWTTLSRARIKADNVQIAMESGGSSGGIRANKVARKPKAGEVRASFIAMDEAKKEIEVFVYAVGPDGIPEAIKPSKKLKIKTNDKMVAKLKKDDVVYFRPVRLEGDSWSIKGISVK